MKATLFILLLLITKAKAVNYYVATNGAGDGSIGSPFGLQAAMNSTSAGDTVWLRGGTYTPAQNSTNQSWSPYLAYYPGWNAYASGSGTNRITYRSYSNEWAAIDGRLMISDSICFRDLEFFNSMKGVRYDTNDLSQNGDFNAVYGHFVNSNNGTNRQWINCVIRDIDDGGFSPGVGAGTMRGCILWYIAWNYREHVFYPMVYEASGNIFAWPLNSTVNNTVAAFSFSSNIVFGAGAQYVGGGPSGDGNYGGANYPDATFSGHKATVIRNVILSSAAAFGGSVGADSIVNSNIVYSLGPTAASIGLSTGCEFLGNSIYGDQHSQNDSVPLLTLTGPTNIAVDYNSYFGNPDASALLINSVSFAAHKTATGYDSHSSASLTEPPDAVRVMPNADQARRCHIAICNWSLADNVSVSLAGVLTAGDTYQLYSAQNYKAGPLRTGTYNGTSISVPMTNLTVVPMVYGTNVNRWGEWFATPPPVSPQFGAFVVQGSSAPNMTVTTLNIGQ